MFTLPTIVIDTDLDGNTARPVICVPDSCNGAHVAGAQSWLRASFSYAIGGWGKAAGPQDQAIPRASDNLEETAVSSQPARELSGLR